MEYDDNSILGFVVDPAGKVSVALIDPALKLKEGQTYKAEFHIDKAAAVPVDAIATNATSVLFPIVKDDAFMAAAMAGNALFVEVGRMVIENPLKGSGKAIGQLAECAMAGVKGG